MTQTDTVKVPLSALLPGHDQAAPAGGINVRTHQRASDLAGLAASILAHGIINPLVAVADREKKGVWYVAAGNRRLASCHKLLADGSIQDSYEVPIKVVTEEEARELGLAENILRASLHPADQYQAYWDLAQAGLSPKSIATRFGLPVKTIKTFLALGALSPSVLQAWRDGRFGEDDQRAMRVAGTFHLARDLSEQDEVLAKLSKNGNIWESAIRELLGAADYKLRQLLLCVGKKAYAAAGGTITEDLFGDGHRISDQPLLERLVSEKLAKECQRLVGEGWAWAMHESALPAGAAWSWPRTTDEDEKSKAGCILSIVHDGTIRVTSGVIKPDDRKLDADQAPTATAPAKQRGALSGALVARLSEQTTWALQSAIKTSPKAGLAALLAGALCSRNHMPPIRVRLEGRQDNNASEADARFEVLLARYMAMSIEQLLEVAAQAAARSIDLGIATPSDSKAVADLAAAIDPASVADALGRAFDAEDFFRSAPKPQVLAAVEEALGAEEVRKIQGKPKAEIAAFALASVVPTGWLPREIRHPAYDGPGAATVEQAAA